MILFIAISKILIYFLVITICLITLYWLKTKLNINLDIGTTRHTPQVLEELSRGYIKCTWFPNPHHCDCYKK